MKRGESRVNGRKGGREGDRGGGGRETGEGEAAGKGRKGWRDARQQSRGRWREGYQGKRSHFYRNWCTNEFAGILPTVLFSLCFNGSYGLILLLRWPCSGPAFREHTCWIIFPHIHIQDTLVKWLQEIKLRNLENMMLSERSQTHEDKDCVLLFLWKSRKDKSRDRKETGGCLRWGAIAHRLWFFYGQMEMW